MLHIAGIDHIVLRTTNPIGMRRFYCEVLGCVVERETPPDTGLTQLRAGSALIDLVAVDSQLGRQGGGAPTKTENNLDHFCLQLAPIAEQELREHFRMHGIDIGKFDERYGAEGFGRSVYLHDPDDNVVELRSLKSPSK